MYQRRVKDLNDEIARLMAECNELADAKVRKRVRGRRRWTIPHYRSSSTLNSVTTNLFS